MCQNQLIMIKNIVSNTTTKPKMLIYESNKSGVRLMTYIVSAGLLLSNEYTN